MILAGKVLFLLMIFLFSPAMLFGAFRGIGVEFGNVSMVAIGWVGFITLQWLL